MQALNYIQLMHEIYDSTTHQLEEAAEITCVDIAKLRLQPQGLTIPEMNQIEPFFRLQKESKRYNNNARKYLTIIQDPDTSTEVKRRLLSSL